MQESTDLDRQFVVALSLMWFFVFWVCAIIVTIAACVWATKALL